MKNEIEFKFGDYAIIEQKRHGVPNEMFVHKVVGQLRSNTWVDVPVRVPATETLHGEMEDICLCICCGIDETEVRRYRVKDMRRHSPVSLVADEKRGSTITQQAVNELIQSLESAGELSIKETKYLDVMRWAVGVAGECDAALNAERAWEKTMMEACGEDGPASVANEIRSLRALRDTAIQALKSQVEQLAAENVGLRPLIAENWNMRDLLRQLMAGRPGGVYFNKWEKLIAEVLNETPATDRIYAGVKADGVEEFVSNTVHKIFDESEAVSALAYLSLANSHVKQLRMGADK